jgi:hypothetical protein
MFLAFIRSLMQAIKRVLQHGVVAHEGSGLVACTGRAPPLVSVTLCLGIAQAEFGVWIAS